jgi:dTDP-4-dehydrorhamnose 3,5-epimerase
LKFARQAIPGIFLIEPDVHRDARGFFFENYHAKKYKEAGIEEDFVQDNHSSSQRGTLRGLHMQISHPQAKLVRVIRGAIWDVAVDVRRKSPTFGQYFSAELSSENHQQLYVAGGLAHGFVVTSAEAEVEYKCSDFYDPTGELAIAWNDPELGIPWPVKTPTLSAKDRAAPSLADVTAKLPEWKG